MIDEYVQIKDAPQYGIYRGLVGRVQYLFKTSGVFVELVPDGLNRMYFDLSEVEPFELDGCDLVQSGAGSALLEARNDPLYDLAAREEKSIQWDYWRKWYGRAKLEEPLE